MIVRKRKNRNKIKKKGQSLSFFVVICYNYFKIVGVMMNNKGQALIEFVLILPIFLMILFVIVDFGMIFSTKLRLENDSQDIVMLLSEGKSIRDINELYDDIEVKVSDFGDELLKIEMTSEVDIITPGMDSVFGDPYVIQIERIVSNDEAW